MKKILNGLGIFGSIFLTLVLSVLIFLYVAVLNIKFVVSEKGMANALKKIDVVETLESALDETMWEDFTQIAESLDLSEEQFEQILNSDKVKEQVGGYIGEVLSSIFNDKEVNLTKEDIENFLNIAIDEYNKVSDIKISDTDRKEIINSFDEEMIANINEEFGSINLIEIVEPEYVEYVKLIDNLLFGNYTLIMLALIILIISLIALFRFSYYKWMPYVKVSTIVSGSLMLIMGLFVLFVPLEDMEIMLPLRKIIATRIFITSILLFILSIGLSVGKKYLKQYIDKKKENVSTSVNEKEEKQKKDKKKINFDKKIIIVIILVLVLLLVILFLIFRRNTYTITFDTNGGTEISSIKVKNKKIVKLIEEPKKDGYIFIGWINEEGKVITKETKVTKDITLKAKWVSNDAETITIEFNTDGESEIDNIIIEKDHIILLPIEPTRDGYIFAGWLDENGNVITEDTIVNENMTITATWQEPYTCPNNCTPIEDGSKCTKTDVQDVVTYTGCPSGTETVENFCSAHKWQVALGFDEDMTYVTAGILCDDNPTGFCVDYNNRYTITYDSCPSGYYKYVDSDGFGAFNGCVKKYNKGGSICPSGYTQSGNVCKKTETISCKAN